MEQKRPRSREKRVSDESKGVHIRGEGLGTGPVGTGGRGQQSGLGKSQVSQNSFSSDIGRRKSSTRSGGKKTSPFLIIIVLVAVYLLGGKEAVSLLFDNEYTSESSDYGNSWYGSSGYSSNGSQGWESLLNSSAQNAQNNNANNTLNNNSGNSANSVSNTYGSNTDSVTVDDTVAKGTREKYTKILGKGKDQTTIMVYMCGTDLESRNGMATADLKEMASASFDEHINVIIYTGGCKSWKIKGISNRANQIYQIQNGNLYCLEDSIGSKTMTDPATLTEFIKYCSKNFPANRNDLILWDHGGGSISGYGYDENNARSGSMNLSGINKALHDANLKFDFIGFDACLMATAENALMLGEYADYLIASEETEPGIGWYYTKWLNAYGKNPSMPTIDIGKNIVDDFIADCSSRCRGQLATLSVIDLAEFSNTVPEKLSGFAADTSKMIDQKQYREIAIARQSSREFSTETRIDQVDLVDLTKKLNTAAAKELGNTLLSAVKYNKTSANMTNAYGVSIYFPNRKLSSVDQAIQINSAIGIDNEYSRCIKAYASLQLAGQSTAAGNGSTGTPFPSLFGNQSYSSASTYDSTDLMNSLLEYGLQMFGERNVSTDFFDEKSIDLEKMAAYISENQFDASQLEWKYHDDGEATMSLSEEQWGLITNLELNMFYDNGKGFVDLGLDTIFDFNEDGDLVASSDKTWLAINNQPVAFYHTSTMETDDSYTITGYVPAMLNGTRVNLLLVFDDDHPFGFISGSLTDYHDEETETSAKANGELQVGDQLEFICDFYNYDGTYQDTYYLGEPMIVTEDMEITNASVGDGTVQITYKITDIYGQNYWTPVVEQ